MFWPIRLIDRSVGRFYVMFILICKISRLMVMTFAVLNFSYQRQACSFAMACSATHRDRLKFIMEQSFWRESFNLISPFLLHCHIFIRFISISSYRDERSRIHLSVASNGWLLLPLVGWFWLPLALALCRCLSLSFRIFRHLSQSLTVLRTLSLSFVIANLFLRANRMLI